MQVYLSDLIKLSLESKSMRELSRIKSDYEMYTNVDTNVYEMFARLICAILLKMQCLIKIVMENKDLRQ